MKLSDWAKKNGLSYRTAYRLWKARQLPYPADEKFLCQKCGYTDNADINAARNILERFLTGQYGAGCKPLNIDWSIS
ncbi:MAG TPA: hypothetical protein ENN45_02675 [Bacteroidetes bacterium]|nr:hypothetical protein [Bacteroidota bacterium]